jgi:N utilization substance protein B
MTRKDARENAFILLFELTCKSGETAEEIFDMATGIRELECDEYVKTVFFGTNSNLRIIDETIEKSLVGWKSSRLSIVTTALLRLATYEMMFFDDIPVKVSINEAIELSKKYDEEKAYMLINGSLNAIAEAIGRK